MTDKSLKKSLLNFVNEFKQVAKLQLLYRASDDGYEAKNFHQKCDDIPNTVTLVRSSNGNVFGGFTTQKWDSHSGYKEDKFAFLFSLINIETITRKFRIKNF